MKKSLYDEHYLCNSVTFLGGSGGGGGAGRSPNILAGKWSIKQEHISEVKKA